jgi:1,4-alpha-glucan branching enzyme
MVRQARALDRAVRTSASLSVACSHAVHDAARQLGYADAKLKVIPNGIDAARFGHLPSRAAARRSLELPERDPVLISVGSLYEHKGHSYLLKAMARVRTEFPNARLLLVGDKHHARRAALQDAVEN